MWGKWFYIYIIFIFNVSNAIKSIYTLFSNSFKYSSSELVSSAILSRFTVDTFTEPTFNAVPPIELKYKHPNIKSPIELAETCKMPIEVAENYWFELEDNEENFHLNSPNDKDATVNNSHKINKSTLLRIGILVILTDILILMAVQQHTSINNTVVFTQDSAPTSTPVTTILPTIIPSDSAETQAVFVTPTGEKYHVKDCKHIKNSINLLELSIDEAIQAGYEPCKDCIR